MAGLDFESEQKKIGYIDGRRVENDTRRAFDISESLRKEFSAREAEVRGGFNDTEVNVLSDAINALKDHADVVILTNLHDKHNAARARQLANGSTPLVEAAGRDAQRADRDLALEHHALLVDRVPEDAARDQIALRLQGLAQHTRLGALAHQHVDRALALEQVADQVPPDETRGARYEIRHDLSPALDPGTGPKRPAMGLSCQSPGRAANPALNFN